jgi:hypothetical protein
MLVAPAAPATAWSAFKGFSKAKVNCSRLSTALPGVITAHPCVTLFQQQDGYKHTGEAPPRGDSRDDSTPTEPKPWSKWFSAKATADETSKTDAKVLAICRFKCPLSVCLLQIIAGNVNDSFLCVLAPQSTPTMKYRIWANGIFMPIDYFNANKQNKQKTKEPPVAPPKVSS